MGVTLAIFSFVVLFHAVFSKFTLDSNGVVVMEPGSEELKGRSELTKHTNDKFTTDFNKYFEKRKLKKNWEEKFIVEENGISVAGTVDLRGTPEDWLRVISVAKDSESAPNAYKPIPEFTFSELDNLGEAEVKLKDDMWLAGVISAIQFLTVDIASRFEEFGYGDDADQKGFGFRARLMIGMDPNREEDESRGIYLLFAGFYTKQ